jgi:two-component system, sensor histidine kinase and response regulator
LLTMFTNGYSKATWVQKVRTELLSMAKEIYNRTTDVVINLEPAELKINQEYLQRLVLELVDNALKFSKHGQKVQVIGKRQNDGYFIEVIDNGRGFRLDSLDDIAPFKQYNRKKFEQQGLGIGLYLVKRLAEFNEGQVKIASVEGEGTHATVELALAEEVEFSQSYEALQVG